MIKVGLALIGIIALVLFLVYKKIKDKKKKKLFLRVAGIILAVFIVLFISFKIVYSIRSRGDVVSSTEKNCELVHNIYVKRDSSKRSFADIYLRDWNKYSKETLYNLGLCSTKTMATWSGDSDREAKKWNGTWIVTEDFIKQYVDKYSAEEFLEVYDLYVARYLEPVVKHLDAHLDDYQMDERFYEQNPELLNYITETTQCLIKLKDQFDVKVCCPAVDQLLDEKSEFEDPFTTDTYEYDGYEVTHHYGVGHYYKDFGWHNGEFVDIDQVGRHSYVVDELYITLPGDYHILARGESLEDLECTWINIGDKKCYVRSIHGIEYASPKDFSQPVIVLTQDPGEVDEEYVKYGV